MKKKVFVLITLIFLLSAGSIFAETGIGAAFGYGVGGSNVALSLDIDAIPGTVQTVSMRFNSNYFGLGITDDWYLIDNVFIDNPFGWYLGLGFYVNMGFSNDFSIAFGARAPIGIDVTLLENKLVLFLEAAPSLGLGFDPGIYFPDWDIAGALGFRFYF